MTQALIFEEFLIASALFNQRFGTHYSRDNVKLAYCTADTIAQTYESFNHQYRFQKEKHLDYDPRMWLAEAFVGQTDIDDSDHIDGILIRTDLPIFEHCLKEAPEFVARLFLHELAHIYCATHEIETAGKAGQRFYDLYCLDTSSTAEKRLLHVQINDGYDIWRDYIAELIRQKIDYEPAYEMKVIAPSLDVDSMGINAANPAAKYSLSRYLFNVIASAECQKAKSWSDLESKLEERDLPFAQILNHIFDMPHDGLCVTIDLDSIATLGALYDEILQKIPRDESGEYNAPFRY